MSRAEIAVPVSDEELAALDQAVADGHFASRSDALLQALRSALASLERRADIEDSYWRAYKEHPEEPWTGEVGLRLLNERVRRERGT